MKEVSWCRGGEGGLNQPGRPRTPFFLPPAALRVPSGSPLGALPGALPGAPPGALPARACRRLRRPAGGRRRCWCASRRAGAATHRRDPRALRPAA